jgi:hypothetical protein
MNSGTTDDPVVSAAIAEYVLLERTHMSIRDLDRLRSDRALALIAVAQYHAQREAEEYEKAKSQVP